MISELFLSLISGLAVIFGLNPTDIFFFIDKMGQPANYGFKTACYLGIFNGLILLWLKFRQQIVEVKLIPYIALPMLFYHLCCESFFLVWVKDLRIFTWIFVGSLSLAYLFIRSELESEKIKLLIIIILSYASQIYGSTTILSLMFFLNCCKVPIKSAVLLPILSFLPVVLVKIFSQGKTFLIEGEPVDWITLTVTYLICCFTFLWTARLLLLLFKSKHRKLPVNAGMMLAVFLLFLTSRLGPNLNDEQYYTFSFPSMGTACEVTMWVDSEDEAKTKGIKVKELIDSIEAALSTYRPSSEINKMNNAAFYEPFKCSEVLWENLLLAEKAYTLSHGSFDVTVGPLVKLWSVKTKRTALPSPQEIKTTLAKVGFSKVKLNKKEKTVRFLHEEMKVDFGGLTKGWAVDQAAIMLLKNGLNKFIINLGGNLYASGQLAGDRQPYKIGIKDPKNPNKLCTKVTIKNQAVATSGNYEQFIMIDGQRYTHIIDPRTGYPVRNVDSVTVIAPTATMCDILSTAIFVEGEKLMHKFETEASGVNVLFIDIREGAAPRILKTGIFTNANIDLH